MANSVVFPRAQFFSNSGRPLVGGRIHTYVAGSSTRARTYQDAANVQINTNPIILDARGEAAIYLAEGVEYKFVVEDSTGALIMTQEPVYGAIWPNAAEWPSDATLSYQYMTDARAAASATGPIKFYGTKAQADAAIGTLATGDIIEVSQDETRAGARTRYKVQAGALVFVVNLDQIKVDLAAATGASLVGFQQAGAGAVVTTVQNKLLETVSVFDFMTDAQVADVTSYTASIDVTSNIAAAVAASYGKKLKFPGGKYKHTGIGIDPNKPCYLYGDGYGPSGNYGTILDNVGATHSISIQNTGVSNDVMHVFEDMQLVGNAGSGNGIWAENEHGIRAQRLWITGHGRNGVLLTDGWSNKFSQCVIVHNQQNGIAITNRGNNITLEQCIVNANGIQAGYHNISLNANATYENLGVNIKGCDFSYVANATGLNIAITNSWGVNIDGCYCENTGAGAGDLGYVGTNAKAVSITNSYFQGGDLTLETGIGHTVKSNIFNKTDIATTLVMRSPEAGNYKSENNQFLNGATASYAGGVGSRTEGYGTAAPTTGTWAKGDICWNSNAGGGGHVIAWICTLGGTPGTWMPFGQLTDIYVNWGDSAATLTPYASFTTNVWQGPITANRAVTLSTTGATPGYRFRISRTIAATGAFTVDVGSGLKSLAAGQWCDVEYSGTAWLVTAFGSLQ